MRADEKAKTAHERARGWEPALTIAAVSVANSTKAGKVPEFCIPHSTTRNAALVNLWLATSTRAQDTRISTTARLRDGLMEVEGMEAAGVDEPRQNSRQPGRTIALGADQKAPGQLSV